MGAKRHIMRNISEGWREIEGLGVGILGADFLGRVLRLRHRTKTFLGGACAAFGRARRKDCGRAPLKTFILPRRAPWTVFSAILGTFSEAKMRFFRQK